MNRRQFIKRTTSALAGLLYPVLRSGTKETPDVLGNSPGLRPFWLMDGRATGKQVIDGIASGLHRENVVKLTEIVTQAERDKVRRIAESLSDGEPITWRIDEFAQCCAAQHPEYAETRPVFSWPVRQAVDRILAANPKITREQAFFQAVTEIAEGVL